MSKKHTEETCIKALRQYFQNGYNYQIDRAFIFNYDWESDFFCMNREGYAFEFEIKISRSDFRADAKKYKHKFFRGEKHTTWKQEKVDNKWVTIEVPVEKKFLPNRFYYVVPEGLVKEEEVPKYAGLIWVDEFHRMYIVKRAPFIHKNKLEFRKVLCDKFYNRFLNERRERAFSKYDMEQLQRKIDAFKEKFPAEFATLYLW